MAKLLFDLRDVPDDEADDVRALLDAHGLDYYETKPAAMGLLLRSMSWRGMRRSLKKRSAARVALEPLTPNI